jgi:hypothetical protein
MMVKKTLLVIIIFISIYSCKREVEIKNIEVEKKTSWHEVKQFTGTQKIILSTGSNENAVFLQQPYFFSVVKPAAISINAASLPTDLSIKIPISRNYFAFPYADTSVLVCNNNSPFPSAAGYVNLRKLDPTMTKVNTYFSSPFKCMTIDQNDVLFLSYQNSRADQPFTFMLVTVKTSTTEPYIQFQSSKQVAILRTDLSGFVRTMTAVNNNYFVDIAQHGVFKVKEDGSFKKVLGGNIVAALYEWQGKVYAHTAANRVFLSSDNGDSFTEAGSIPGFMASSTYYHLKDSLIGVSGDNLFTLKWSENGYAARFLKNDGVEGTQINGVEVLKDSVYVATTSGLFVKALSALFDSK